MATKTYQRAQNGEAIINESNKEASREQVVLVADSNGYPPNCLLAKLTAGGDSGKWCRWNPAGANGAQTARGYLYESRPASTGTQRATALVRDTELNGKKIAWGTADNSQKAAAIASLIALDTTFGYGNVRVRY